MSGEFRNACASLTFALALIGCSGSTAQDEVHESAGGPVTSAPRHVEFKSTTEVTTEVGEEGALRLWIPAPRSNGFQDVADPLRFEVDWEPALGAGRDEFVGAVRIVDTPDGNRSVFVETPEAQGAGTLAVRLTAEVTRWARSREGDPDGSGRARPADLLGPDALVPLGGPVAAFAQTVPRGGDAFVTGRHIFDAVLDSMAYDKSIPGWGRGDAVRACDVKTGNCTDFHALFIGAARSLGIPARFTIGYSLPAEPQSDEIVLGGYHCWAEYHVEGVGWIPVDISEADKDPSRTEDYFGALPPNRISLTSGRDLVLDPPQAGAPLNYFVAPLAERGGSPVTALAHHVSVRDL